jgi:hypothetical protein
MSHSNGVRALSELVIVTSSLEADVPRYANAAQSSAERQGDDWTILLPHDFRLTLISPARYRKRYGEQCVDADGRHSFFGAIVFDAREPGRIRDLASSIPDLRVGTDETSLAVLIPFLNTLLEFRERR